MGYILTIDNSMKETVLVSSCYQPVVNERTGDTYFINTFVWLDAETQEVISIENEVQRVRKGNRIYSTKLVIYRGTYKQCYDFIQSRD